MADGPALDRTKPGSRARRILLLIYDLVEAHQRGVQISEIREAYSKSIGNPAPSSLTSEVSSMKRRGVLEAVGGRAGRTLYAPAGHRVEGAPDSGDPAHDVVEAVNSAYRRLGRALSTREVDEELRRVSPNFPRTNSNTVRKYLETLAKARERGPERSRDPRVLRIDRTTVAGHASTHWAPVASASADALSVAPRSGAEAVRNAIAVTSRALGRPVSLLELRWWFGTREGALHAEILSPERIGTALADTVKRDSEFQGDVGRVHVVATWFSCPGGAPERYSSGPVSEVEGDVCEFEDMLWLFRPATERAGIEVLRRRGERLRSETFLTLSGIRSSVLAGRFSGWADDRPIAEIAERSLEAQRTITDWHRDTAGLNRDQKQSRIAELREWHKQWEVGVELLFNTVPAEGFPSSILDAGHASLNDLDPLLKAAAARLRVDDPQSRKRLVVRVRRIRPIQEVVDPHGQERFGRAADLELAVLDRVEALLALWELFRVPRATALLHVGAQIVGEVFRDSSYLTMLLERAPEGDAYTRRALVVALGLLGTPTRFETAVPDRSDPDDSAAWALSAVLADWARAEEILSAAVVSARGEAGRVLDTALMRVQAGALFSLVG